MVRRDVATTASKAHGDHQGHDNFCASSDFAIASAQCRIGSNASSEFRRECRGSCLRNSNVVKFQL